jgi:hypothetical protein
LQSNNQTFIKDSTDLILSNLLKTADWGCGNYSMRLEDFALLMEMDVEKLLANAAYFNTKEE